MHLLGHPNTSPFAIVGPPIRAPTLAATHAHAIMTLSLVRKAHDRWLVMGYGRARQTEPVAPSADPWAVYTPKPPRFFSTHENV